MTGRNRRVRRQISDDVTEESEDSTQDTPDSEEEDFDPRRADAMRRAGRQDANASLSPTSSRSKRTGSGVPAIGRTTIQRSASNSSDDRKQSLKLTVKAPPSKLREVMRVSEIDSLHDTLGGGRVIEGSRRRRPGPPPRSSGRASRSKYAEYGESDIEDEDEVAAEQEDDFSKLGAEAEGGTDDDEEEDIEMEDAPMPPKAPKITLKAPVKSDPKSAPKAPKLIVTPAPVGPLKSVEDQEMEDDPGDEEVEDSSDLSGDDEDEEDEEEDGDEDDEEEDGEDDDEEGEEDEEEEEADQITLTQAIAGVAAVELEKDAPGEDDQMEDDEEDDDDSSDETLGSGAATPDPNKMTKRQRGRADDSNGLMALDMAPQQRKFFTDAEKAMKKDEHARKRKELTKRKIQEEKTAALNRLLKPQASKARGAAPKPETLAKITQEAGELSEYEEEYVEKANPLYTRWVSTKDGVKLGVPEEWLGKRVGRLFGPPLPPSNGAMIQELD